MTLNVTKTFAYNHFQLRRCETKVDRLEKKLEKARRRAEKYATICAEIDAERLLANQAKRIDKAQKQRDARGRFQKQPAPAAA